MAKLQAKTKEQQEFVRSKLADSWLGIVNEDRVELDGWVDFDQMAEIVDYLRQNCERDIVEENHVIAGYGDPNEWARLLDENRKLNNDNFRLLEENKQLKEKTKNLPRIATLNKRIHELKEQLKDGNKQSI